MAGWFLTPSYCNRDHRYFGFVYLHWLILLLSVNVRVLLFKVFVETFNTIANFSDYSVSQDFVTSCLLLLALWAYQIIRFFSFSSDLHLWQATFWLFMWLLLRLIVFIDCLQTALHWDQINF
jgi:hypothetical protein